jgi:hypothetical protein
VTTSLLQPVRGFDERSRSFTAAAGVRGWLTDLTVCVAPVLFVVLDVDVACVEAVELVLTDALVLLLPSLLPPPQPATAAETRAAASAATTAAAARGP